MKFIFETKLVNILPASSTCILAVVPGIPVAPTGPVEPVAPAAPVAPVGPVAPVEPAPVAPVAPTIPLTSANITSKSFAKLVVPVPLLRDITTGTVQ